MSYLLKCGYIRRNIANTIFHPDFILYLSGQLKRYKTLDSGHVKNAVGIWNNSVVNSRKKIRYQQGHFNKLATLSASADGCDDTGGCVINAEDLAILRYWMTDLVAEVADDLPTAAISSSGLMHLNVENNKKIDSALQIIIEDPVGRQLVANAINNNITLKAEHLHDHKGYFEYTSKTIVIDPTVAGYVLKINCIAHELVHASNLDLNNSVTEETLAEIIGMAVQDKITNIEISCSPYVVFVDRLLDPHYGRYPLENNIEKHLRRAGIIINGNNESME